MLSEPLEKKLKRKKVIYDHEKRKAKSQGIIQRHPKQRVNSYRNKTNI